VLLAGLLTLALTVVTGVALYGFFRLNVAPNSYSKPEVHVNMASERVARGQRLANICIDCHSSSGSFPLDGSKDNFATGGPPVGVIYAPNLTPGGPLKDWTDGEVMRAMREGVDKNGRPLIIMPSQPMHNLSDEDAQAIVAFLRSQPAVDRPLPERNMNVLAALFVGAGLFPMSAQTPITQPIIAPQAGTAEYGNYLVRSLGCPDCHGQNLAGTSGGFGPSGPNLTYIVPSWSQENFIALFREGKDPTGRQISTNDMPWKSYSGAMTDDELAAVYKYLHGLAPIEASTK
jgi:mono/diheme cytochrome c family protein